MGIQTGVGGSDTGRPDDPTRSWMRRQKTGQNFLRFRRRMPMVNSPPAVAEGGRMRESSIPRETTVRMPETTNWAMRTQKMAKRRLFPLSAAAKATDAARARKIQPRPLTRKDQRFVRAFTSAPPPSFAPDGGASEGKPGY